MNRLIEVVISPQGAARVETKGFTGSSCREASGFIEAALGHRASESLTSEFHRASVVQQNANQRS